MNDIKTVADKIRSMNDDELAVLLSQIGYESYKNEINELKELIGEPGDHSPAFPDSEE